jgi:hypothetical protein
MLYVRVKVFKTFHCVLFKMHVKSDFWFCAQFFLSRLLKTRNRLAFIV